MTRPGAYLGLAPGAESVERGQAEILRPERSRPAAQHQSPQSQPAVHVVIPGRQAWPMPRSSSPTGLRIVARGRRVPRPFRTWRGRDQNDLAALLMDDSLAVDEPIQAGGVDEADLCGVDDDFCQSLVRQRLQLGNHGGAAAKSISPDSLKLRWPAPRPWNARRFKGTS
jgi:hypothetical protein